MAGGKEKLSSVKSQTLTPTWRESFELGGVLERFEATGVKLELLDKDEGSTRDYLGEVIVGV